MIRGLLLLVAKEASPRSRPTTAAR